MWYLVCAITILKNKHELYETAVTQYAKECSEPFLILFSKIDLSLDEIIKKIKKGYDTRRRKLQV